MSSVEKAIKDYTVDVQGTQHSKAEAYKRDGGQSPQATN